MELNRNIGGTEHEVSFDDEHGSDRTDFMTDMGGRHTSEDAAERIRSFHENGLRYMNDKAVIEGIRNRLDEMKAKHQADNVQDEAPTLTNS